MSVIVSGSVVVSGSTDVGYKTNIDGLSLYLDARNPNSYPGSGDTWFDLSIGSNNVSTRLATYNSTPPASFGITSSIAITPIIDFVSSPTPPLIEKYTIETVIKPTSFLGPYNPFLGFNYPTFGIIFGDGGNLFYWPGNIPQSAIADGEIVILNTWQYFVFELFIGKTPSDSKLYKNGVSIPLALPATPGGTVSYNNGVGQIFGDTSVSCSVFKTYNRALTQQEITNNYNYYKPIFNLS
jgi:hypothetical protein